MLERRAAAREIRVEGRRLSGTVLVYGDTSPSHQERFEPGSLRFGNVPLNLHHEPLAAAAWHPGGGLELRQDADALRMVAELPPIPAADRALAEVRSGRATGLSVEFLAESERREGGIRVIEAALLSGIGLVRDPSYGQSRVEARARSGFKLRASVPAGKKLSCECASAKCQYASIIPRAMEKMWDDTFTAFQNEAIAAMGNYSKPLASVGRGTMRGAFAGGVGNIEIDLPDSPPGRAVLEASENAGIVARPLFADVESTIVDDTEVISNGRLRAIIISSTDSRQGWPEPEILGPEPPDVPTPRRRAKLWL